MQFGHKTWIPWLALTLAAALVNGCANSSTQSSAAAQPSPSDGRNVVFQCTDGRSITVAFAEGVATLDAGGAPVQLTQQPAGSGILYSGGGHTLRGKGPDMTWTEPDGVMRDCRDQTAAASAENPLTGTSWRLIHFQSPEDSIGTVVPPNVEQYTLQFMADGTLAMQLDCNRGTARWTAQPVTPTDGLLTISQGAITSALCLPGAIDSQLARDLQFVHSYVLVGDKLSLVLKIDSGIYLWEPMNNAGN